MIGSHIGITDRDRRLIAEVTRLGAVTRDQLQRLGFFHSVTRAKERLKKLVDAGYLECRRQPLPSGGPRGVYFVGSSSGTSLRRLAKTSDLFLSHFLGLVEIRIAFEARGRTVLWTSDRDLADRKLEVVPDAYLELDQGGRVVCAFIEYDRGTETLARFERKVRTYIHLAYSGLFSKTFQRTFFRVLVVTDSIGRLASLSHLVAKQTDRIFRFALLSELQHQGALASIWRRPGAKTSESLIEH